MGRFNQKNVKGDPMIYFRYERMHQHVEGARKQRVKDEAGLVIKKIDGNPLLSARFGTIRKTVADIRDRQVSQASGIQLGQLANRVHSCHTTIQGAESFFSRHMP